jgi:hypothetical protein
MIGAASLAADLASRKRYGRERNPVRSPDFSPSHLLNALDALRFRVCKCNAAVGAGVVSGLLTSTAMW